MHKNTPINENLFKVGDLEVNEIDRIKFGKFLKSSRQNRKWTQKTLAAKGIGASTIRDVENSTKPISQITLSRIQKIFEFSSISTLLQSAGLVPLALIENNFKVLREQALEDSNISHLPSLFEITERLPIADCYVELYLTPRSPRSPRSPQRPKINQLVVHKTYAQKKEHDELKQLANRLAAQDALDSNEFSNILILGDPGTGKSSLLRKITIDICNKKWRTYDLALFVEARAYWTEYSKTSLSIVEHAVRRSFQENLNTSEEQISDAINHILFHKDKILFVIDGLDEIAGDQQAVDAVYSMLEQRRFNWITSSRPAGLIKSPNETHRYTLAELSEDGIEALISNWASISLKLDSEAYTDKLTSEILTSNSLMGMASNPFLLTAIIYLKSLNIDELLPRTKVELYEILIEKIGDQARQKAKNQSILNPDDILNPDTLKKLASFAYQLFQMDEGPLQLFKLDHWLETFPDSKDCFDKNILPARLITEQFDPYKRFHFLHLTLHEHLIACHMLKMDVTDMLEYRYLPAWTNTFIHYGALLHHKGNLEDFKHLVSQIYLSRDLADAQLILMANIFSACGIKDTTPWIKVDLREIMFNVDDFALSDTWHAYFPALGALDPEWFAEHELADIKNNEIEILESVENENENENLESVEPSYKYAKEIIYGNYESTPFQLILKAKSAYSRQVIRNEFWGDDEKTAMLAIAAFAQIASKHDIDKITRYLNDEVKSEKYFNRCLCVLFFNKHENLSLRLFDHLTFWWEDKELRNWVTATITSSGGRSAYAFLTQLALEIYQANEPIDNMVPALKGIKRLSGPLADEAFETLLSKINNKTVRAFIRSHFKLNNNEKYITEFNQTENYNKIKFLNRACKKGFSITPEIIQKVNSLSDVCIDNSIEELIAVQSNISQKDTLLSLSDIILQSCKRLYRQFQNNNYTLEDLGNNIETAFAHFIASNYLGAKTFAESCILQGNCPEYILIDMINYTGSVSIRSKNITLLNCLEEILFDDNYDDDRVRKSALLAIGRISPYRLSLLRSHHFAKEAFIQLVDHHDWQFYECFWVDEYGAKHTYPKVPLKVSILYSPDDMNCQQFARFVGTKLSQNYMMTNTLSNEFSENGFIIYKQQQSIENITNAKARKNYLSLAIPTIEGGLEMVVDYFNTVEHQIEDYIQTFVLPH